MPKHVLQLKDPDRIGDFIYEVVKSSMPEGLDPEEIELLMDSRRAKAMEFFGQFFEFGEYLRVEFDTDMGTATVLRRK